MNSQAPVESLTSDKPSSKPAAAKPRAVEPPKKGSAFPYVVLLLLLAAAGAGYYFLYQSFIAQQNQLSELQKTVRGLDNHPTLIEIKQRLVEQNQRIDDTVMAQQSTVDELQQALTATRQLVGRDQSGWILAEVEYLQRLAITRLRLTLDIKGAMAALEVADQRLAELADPTLLEVRELLAAEITALKSLAIPDIEGAALKLLSIANRLYLLPPAKRAPISTDVDQATTEIPVQAELTGWQKFWDSLLRFVGARRTTEPNTYSALQAELYYVEQMLRLELEYARHAALRLDKESFDKHLNASRNLLDEHFDRDHEQVILIRAELGALIEANLIPELPDIARSMRKLRDLQTIYRVELAPPAADDSQ